MRIRFLGTAAAEGVPGLGCTCEVCKRARAEKGHNIRTRHQSIIDGELLIDLPPDTFSHFIDNDIYLDRIRNLIVTHVHGDHFRTNEISMFRRGYNHVDEDWQGLTVWGSKDVADAMQTMLSDKSKNYLDKLDYEEMQPYKTYAIGNYTVTPLKAHHGTENPFNYIISGDGKSILYLHDTGWPLDETLSFLGTVNKVFDLVTYDCTMGNTKGVTKGFCHMGLEMNVELRKWLEDAGKTDGHTVHVVNHFTHNAKNAGHDDMTRDAAALGFIATYDGMEIEI